MEKTISMTDLISTIAYWGIRQSPYLYPKNLENALISLKERINQKGIFKSSNKREIDNYAEIDVETLKELIHDLIFHTPEIAIWNVTQSEQEKGITDPNDERRTVKFAGFDRHNGPWQTEDNDFIDLYALEANIVQHIWEE